MTHLKATLRPYISFAVIAMVILTGSRLGLVIWQADRLDGEQILQTLVNGLRVDVMTLSMTMILPIVLLAILPRFILHSRLYQRLITCWLAAWLTALVFMEVVTPVYMDFFSVRPGRIFFEYLNRPMEVAGLISGGYPVAAVLAIIIPATLVYFSLPWLKPAGLSAGVSGAQWRLWHRMVIIPIVLLLILGGRSTLGHRPANPSTFAISGDQLVNDLGLNSTYRLLYAVYSLRHEEDPGRFYPEMSNETIIATVQADSGNPADSYLNAASTQHRFGAGGQPAKLRNILIIVQESLGARFIGALGGLPLSPYLDTMADQGIWFERLYATGIRSARGLEAIVAGFPPSPARSVLKLSGSQTGFYTMAETLRPLGYRNYFIYGGEAHFDNMQGFFLNNGFDEAIDINDYDEWIFKGTWGVSDEDLFEKTHQVLENSEQPVFAVAFTSSFHSPFEFPDGRIELYEEPKQSKHNAVKYADYAVGQFIEKARQSDYWQDTLVLIVADHDERPRGYDLVPVSSYHIPGVILGADVTPRKVSRITSQIDLIPTLLGLAGISGIAPFPGENVLAAPADSHGRAVMQYGDNHAYMRGDQVVIHRPDLPAAQFRYDRQSDLLEPALPNPEMADRALAWALLPGLLYREKLYGVYRQESLPVAEK